MQNKKCLFLINFHLAFYFLHCFCFLIKFFSMKMVTLSSTTSTFSFLLQLFIFMPILLVSFSKGNLIQIPIIFNPFQNTTFHIFYLQINSSLFRALHNFTACFTSYFTHFHFNLDQDHQNSHHHNSQRPSTELPLLQRLRLRPQHLLPGNYFSSR